MEAPRAPGYRHARTELAQRLALLAALVNASPSAAPRLPSSALSPDADLRDTDAVPRHRVGLLARAARCRQRRRAAAHRPCRWYADRVGGTAVLHADHGASDVRETDPSAGGARVRIRMCSAARRDDRPAEPAHAVRHARRGATQPFAAARRKKSPFCISTWMDSSRSMTRSATGSATNF